MHKSVQGIKLGLDGVHSNGRTTNGRTTYSRTTYNRTVSAMVCTINNMQCDHLTNLGDEMNIPLSLAKDRKIR